MFYYCIIRFVVWLIEKGRRLYGVGTSHQLYIIIDRTPSKTGPTLGPAGIATAVPILRSVFQIVQVNTT